MKRIFLLIALFIFFGCKRTEKKVMVQDVSIDSLVDEEYKRDSVYNPLFEKDSLVIVNPYNDTTILTKEELNYLEKNYSGLFGTQYALDPDMVFNQRHSPKDDTLFNHFTSEVGQDHFYILYGYFLSIQNGVEKYKNERKRLIDIYNSINDIHRKISGGGTYFGHTSQRIIGYAEYAVNLYALRYSEEQSLKYEKQKQLFFQSLKQNFEDGIELRKEMRDNEKQKFRTDIFEKINQLDKQIDSYFYLSMARQFEYSKYY